MWWRLLQELRFQPAMWSLPSKHTALGPWCAPVSLLGRFLPSSYGPQLCSMFWWVLVVAGLVLTPFCPLFLYSRFDHKVCNVPIAFSSSLLQSVTPSGPPTPPEDLKSTPRLKAGSIQLTWRPPANTGGRTDIVYNVLCERCNGAMCAPCGGRLRFEPAHTSFHEPEVIVSELEPHINYTFKVEALNGVSHLSPQKSTANITIVLHFTGMNFSSCQI